MCGVPSCAIRRGPRSARLAVAPACGVCSFTASLGGVSMPLPRGVRARFRVCMRYVRSRDWVRALRRMYLARKGGACVRALALSARRYVRRVFWQWDAEPGSYVSPCSSLSLSPLCHLSPALVCRGVLSFGSSCPTRGALGCDDVHLFTRWQCRRPGGMGFTPGTPV